MRVKGLLTSASIHRSHVSTRLVAAVLLATVAVLGGCSSNSKPPPPPSASTLIGAGTVLFKQGDYNGAAQLFQQALALDPTNAVAHYDLGTAYQSENRVDEARAEYQQAIAKDPSMVAALYNEATLDTTRDPAMAIFLYRKVVAMQPDSPTAYLNLGLLEHNQRLKAEAGVDLRKAVQMEPSLRAQIPAADIPDLALPPPSRYHPTTTTSPAP
jgi:tetratricopeptide (TPR) repeat protein